MTDATLPMEETAGAEAAAATQGDVNGGRERRQVYHAFLEDVRTLYGTDKGRLAMLRRNAGNTLAEARGTAWFYRYLNQYAPLSAEPGRDRVGSSRQEVFFLVATLFAADKRAMENGLSGAGDLGQTLASLRKAKSGGGQDPVEGRFLMLLDSTFERDGGGEMMFRLRQTAKYILSKDKRIYWPQLLQDLLRWGHPDKFVQKRWARSFYGAPSPTENSAESMDAGLETDETN